MDNIKKESIELMNRIKLSYEELLNIIIEDEKKGVFKWNIDDKEDLKKRIKIYQFILKLLEEE